MDDVKLLFVFKSRQEVKYKQNISYSLRLVVKNITNDL